MPLDTNIRWEIGDDRQVTTEEAEQKAQEFNVMFIETSAKAGHNVKVLFKKIAQALPGMDKDADAANAGATANKSKSCPDKDGEDSMLTL